MNRLALLRLELSRKIRGGSKPSATELKAQADEMRNLAQEFTHLWRLRNRLSRLADNLAGFHNAASEAEEPAGE